MKQISHPKIILRISVRKSNVVEFYEMVPIPDRPQVTLAGEPHRPTKLRLSFYEIAALAFGNS